MIGLLIILLMIGGIYKLNEINQNEKIYSLGKQYIEKDDHENAIKEFEKIKDYKDVNVLLSQQNKLLNKK